MSKCIRGVLNKYVILLSFVEKSDLCKGAIWIRKLKFGPQKIKLQEFSINALKPLMKNRKKKTEIAFKTNGFVSATFLNTPGPVCTRF